MFGLLETWLFPKGGSASPQSAESAAEPIDRQTMRAAWLRSIREPKLTGRSQSAFWAPKTDCVAPLSHFPIDPERQTDPAARDRAPIHQDTSPFRDKRLHRQLLCLPVLAWINCRVFRALIMTFQSTRRFLAGAKQRGLPRV